MPITPEKILKALEDREMVKDPERSERSKEPRFCPKEFPSIQYPEPNKVEAPENAPVLVG